MSRVIGAVLAGGGLLLAVAALLFAAAMVRSQLQAGILNDAFGAVVIALILLVAGLPVAAGVGLFTLGWSMYRR